MPLTLEQLAGRRPYLYHSTSEANIASIESSKVMYSVDELLELAGRERLLRIRRAKSVRLDLKGPTVSLRDQEPLHAGNIEMRHGWTFGDVVEMLNQHVYFWPGDASGPSKYGARHFSRYEREGEKLVMLRVAVTDLLRANPSNPPKLCRYNSGSPRCSGGKRSPRGDDTFQTEREFEGTPSDVVEVVFRGWVRLPDEVSYGSLSGGVWQKA